MPRLANGLSSPGLYSLSPSMRLGDAGLYLIKSDIDGGRWMIDSVNTVVDATWVLAAGQKSALPTHAAPRKMRNDLSTRVKT